MKRRILFTLLFVGCGVLSAGWATSSLSEESKVDSPQSKSELLVPTIRQIMHEAHRCRTAYIRDVRTEFEKNEPNWSLAEARSRDLVRVGKLLALNTPPKGTAESWERLTNLYIARASILVDAAERQDREEGKLVARRMVSMCATCHSAHR